MNGSPFARRLSRRGALQMATTAAAGLVLAPAGLWAAEAHAPRAMEPGSGSDTDITYLTAANSDITYFVCCATSGEIPLHNAFDKHYNKTHPGVVVKAQYLPTGVDYFGKLQTLIAANTVPALFDMWEGYVQPYAQAGVLEDLTPFMQADPSLKLSDFNKSTIAVNSYKGRLYAMPFTGVANPVLYYNADLLDKAHIKHPDASWTWDTLRSAAKELTIRRGGKTVQWGAAWDTTSFVQWLPWIWSNGGDFFNADATRCTADMPQNIQAIQFWADLLVKDKVAPATTAMQATGGLATGFQQGHIALYLGYTWDVGTFETAKHLNWREALPPKAPRGKRISYYNDGSIAMSVTAKDKQAAFAYLKAYATVFEKQRTVALGDVPAYRPLQGYWVSHANKRSNPDVTLELLPEARYPGGGTQWAKIATIAQAELDRVFNGTETAAKALATIVPKANAALRQGSGL